MNNLKKHWDTLPRYRRLVILKENHFWGGLSDFSFNNIPEDLKPILRREMEGKQP